MRDRRLRRFALTVVLVALVSVLLTTSDSAHADGFTQSAVFAYGDSLELDSAGNPVISYDLLPDGTFLIRCNDPDCSGDDETFAETELSSAFVLDINDHPVSVVGSGLQLLHCNDPLCAGGDDSLESISSGPVSEASLVLDQDGYPVIAYISDGDLLVARCNDPNCHGGNENVSVVDTASAASNAARPRLELDLADHPVIAYTFGDYLRVARCNDLNCAGGDETVGSPGGSTTGPVSFKLDASDNPAIVYGFNLDLTVLHCNDPACVGGDESTTTPDTFAGGLHESLVLDISGNPVIAYRDDSTSQLKIMHCNDPDCAGGDETISGPFPATFNTEFTSLELDAAGDPVVAYTAGLIHSIKLLHCNDVDCAGGDDSNTYPSMPLAAPAPDSGEMALNVVGGDCDDLVRPTTCDVPAGDPFSLTVDILDAPEDGYVLAETYIDFGDDLVYAPSASPLDEIMWPECEPATAHRGQFDGTLPPPAISTSKVNHGCLTGLLAPKPVSHYEDQFLDLSFECSEAPSSSVVYLLPDHTPVSLTSGTLFVQVDGTFAIRVQPATTKLTINCVEPAAVGGASLDSVAPLGGRSSGGQTWLWTAAVAGVCVAVLARAALAARRSG